MTTHDRHFIVLSGVRYEVRVDRVPDPPARFVFAENRWMGMGEFIQWLDEKKMYGSMCELAGYAVSVLEDQKRKLHN